MADKKTNRWLIVAGGVIINLMLGITYTWSIFGSTLDNQTGPYKWTTPEQTLVFSIMLLFFALTMPIAGRIQDKRGPRLVALIGGVLLGIGFIASSQALYDKTLMYITYGVLAGAGVGFAYGAPIAAGNKWFPDKRGLIAGIMVFGFGFGSVLLAPIAQVMINGLPAQPKGLIQPLIVSLFQMPVLSSLLNIGLQNTFMTLGAVFLVVICAGALVLRNPPEGWKPEGWDTVENQEGSNACPQGLHGFGDDQNQAVLDAVGHVHIHGRSRSHGHRILEQVCRDRIQRRFQILCRVGGP